MYNFRLKFELSEGTSFNCEESCLKISSSNKDIVYTLYPANKEKSIKDSSVFIIKGVGFSTEEKAYEEESKARKALMWYGTKFNVGVNFNKKTGRFSKFAKKFFLDKFGVRVLNDKFGVNVYSESDKQTYFGSVSAKGSVIKSVKPFIETFQQGLNIELNDKENLGFELYNASCFESSIRARFLTLIIAIESLIKQKSRNYNVVEYVKFLIKKTRQTDLNKNDIESLVSKLEELKSESISSGGKSLIRKYLKSKQYNSKSAEIFFNDCYKIRGKLVHTGNPPEKTGDFSKITNELNKMVSDLLILCIED